MAVGYLVAGSGHSGLSDDFDYRGFLKIGWKANDQWMVYLHSVRKIACVAALPFSNSLMVLVPVVFLQNLSGIVGVVVV